MRLIALVIVFLLFANLGQAQEECVFDKTNKEAVLLKLQKKYPGSKFAQNLNTLEITRDKEIIKYQRGGCNHFGEKIKYLTSENSDYSNKTILFDQVTKIAKEFFRDLISGNELEDILKQGKYSYSKLGSDDLYSIPHDQLFDLSIIYSRKGKYHSIVV